jgi:hypothetical protein
MAWWWSDNPLRGVSRGERARLFKLSRSGRRIEDPRDADLVHRTFQYWQRLARSALWKALIFGVPMLTAIGFAVLAVAWFSGGNTFRGVWYLGLAATAAWSLVSVLAWWRGTKRTAEANGWT